MSNDGVAGPSHWQARTVERTLGAARDRAISRGDQFIAAATHLLRSTGKVDFTVQEVVDQSGLSLRSFYQHFATKDDLLLALLEETVRGYIAGIRPRVEAETDPVEQLRVLLRLAFGSPESDDPASRGLVIFQWQLASTRTHEYAATLGPQVELTEGIIAAGVRAGRFRDDLPVAALTSLVTNTMLSLLNTRVMGVNVLDHPITADELVAWCLGALAPLSRV